MSFENAKTIEEADIVLYLENGYVGLADMPDCLVVYEPLAAKGYMVGSCARRTATRAGRRSTAGVFSDTRTT
jgi:hypothetical protein